MYRAQCNESHILKIPYFKIQASTLPLSVSSFSPSPFSVLGSLGAILAEESQIAGHAEVCGFVLFLRPLPRRQILYITPILCTQKCKFTSNHCCFSGIIALLGSTFVLVVSGSSSGLALLWVNLASTCIAAVEIY